MTFLAVAADDPGHEDMKFLLRNQETVNLHISEVTNKRATPALMMMKSRIFTH